jgi:hypothetical protein
LHRPVGILNEEALNGRLKTDLPFRCERGRLDPSITGEGESMMRGLLRWGLLLSVLAALIAVAGTSVASANDHVKSGTDSFVDVIDCTGNLYAITITFNSVFHEKNGKITGTTTGDFVATPVAAGQAASGHFTSWGNFHENADGSVAGAFTFHVNGKYAERHAVQHPRAGAVPSSFRRFDHQGPFSRLLRRVRARLSTRVGRHAVVQPSCGQG